MQGSSLKDDEDSNGDLYGREMTAREVFALPASPAPAAATEFRDALKSIAPFSR